MLEYVKTYIKWGKKTIKIIFTRILCNLGQFLGLNGFREFVT